MTKIIIDSTNIVVDKNGIISNHAFKYVSLENFITIKELLDKNLIEIVSGEDEETLKNVKREMHYFLDSKSEKQKRGSVAELLTHLVIKELGFVQEFIFKNLEESSMKKGFDGLYSNVDNFWLMESKSSNIEGTQHKSKINEALVDLRNKIEGKHKSNAFWNAANHIKVVRSDPNKNLLKEIQRISKEYSQGIYPETSEFNLIPASTLFLEHGQDLAEIMSSITALLPSHEYKDIIIICIDNKIFDDFIDYLRGYKYES